MMPGKRPQIYFYENTLGWKREKDHEVGPKSHKESPPDSSTNTIHIQPGYMEFSIEYGSYIIWTGKRWVLDYDIYYIIQFDERRNPIWEI